jgi:predicted metalloprotease
LAFILAHELGHHVQNQLGIFDAGLFTIQEELQADCFAGVWGRSVFEQGSLEEGDLGEAAEELANVADVPGTPWDHPGAHGTESQRIDAFFTGYETGRPRQCTF